MPTRNYRCTHKIEAAQWFDTDENREHFAEWFDMNGYVFETRGPVVVLPEEGQVIEGEWIVLMDGEFVAMEDEQFKDSYAEVE